MFNIDNFDTQTLAKIYNKLNHWEWASELGESNYDELPEHIKDDKNTPTKYSVCSPIMNIIENKIGTKECLRWHHLNNLKRTNEQFEQWWDREHNNLWKVIEPNQM